MFVFVFVCLPCFASVIFRWMDSVRVLEGSVFLVDLVDRV